MITSLKINCALLLAATPLHAQIVADGATNTLSNVTNTFTGVVTVGTNGSFTLLVLSDNALLTNSVNGIIGRNSTAKSNEVRLISSTSRWRMGGSLFVGSNGMSSRLVVSNGALLEDLNGNLGFAAASGNNAVLITGPGSLWTNRGSVSISPGIIGSSSSNRLVVSSSATLVSGTASVGGLGNQVSITGAGSRWANQSDFSFGGAGNRLDLSDGAGLLSSNATISGLVSGDDNTIFMTGTGTAWTNTGDLTMGFGGARAVLTASGGATLFVAGRASLGAIGGANSNSVSVADLGTSWSIGSDLYVGSGGSANLLAISSGGVVVSSNAFLGSLTGASGNSAVVVGAGSLWSNRNLLLVGEAGTGNRLVVSNGGSVVSGKAVVGSASTSGNNLVSISGPGSLWRTVRSFASGDFNALILGDVSAGNQLVVSNGGTVQVVGGYLVVGNTNSAISNSVRLTGAGTSLRVLPGSGLGNPYFFIGRYGARARLAIEDGATLDTHGGYVGTFNSSTDNLAIVTGPGSLWTNATGILVGSIHGDRLVVSNGASLHTHDLDAGTGYDSETVATGAGTVVTVQHNLAVGTGFGSSNRLVIENAAALTSDSCQVGDLDFLTHDNAILVAGSGSVLSNRSLLLISGRESGVAVSNGAAIYSGDATMGSLSNAIDSEALVTGPGSTWSNRSLFIVGKHGRGHQLVVANGGAVSSGDGFIVGEQATSTNNRVIVDGTLRATNASSTATLDIRRGTNVFNAGLMDVDQLLLTHPGTKVTNVFTGTYGISSTISIPAGGPANPYPSTFGILGATGLITRVTVTLSNLSHAHPADLDILLVSPAGQKVMLMSDAGGTNAITNVRLTFQDGTNFLPSVGPIATGTYRPTDYVADENLPSPAPARPYSTDLFSFNGSSPNGLWKLYVSDGFNPDSGTLVGWGLRIETAASVVHDQGIFELNGGTLITRGAVISNGLPFVVGTSGGTPAVWDVRAGVTNTFVAGDVTIGSSASFNQLILTNGALLTNSGYGYVGKFATTSNSATLAGLGSRWLLQDDIIVGGSGVGHLLWVSGGALVGCSSGMIGNTSGSSNLAVVTGGGSAWINSNNLYVGNLGPANTLIVSNNALVSAANTVFVGADIASTNNRVIIDAGTLRVTNAATSGLLDIRRGKNVLNAGLIQADIVRMTNAPHGILEFNGGTLSARSSMIFSGTILRLGNGVSPATLFLTGNGAHNFSGNLLTMVSSNAVLTGNGTLLGGITISSGAKLIPGVPQGGIGKMVFSNSPALQGAVIMEISKTGATLTNDQVQVSGTLTYGGTLTVTNIGPAPLATGDRFQLFSAANYAGSFTSLLLPPLNAGLDWTNKLLVDGSIEVFSVPLPAPRITGLTLDPTNGFPKIFVLGEPNETYGIEAATNLNAPILWQRIASPTADASGVFQFTDTNAPLPVRFYRVLFP